jgi:membrane protein YdbS with pleckstrin-like domain
MRCPACQAEVAQQAVYCHQCGARIHPAAMNPSGDSHLQKTTTGAFENAVAGQLNDRDEQEEELWRGCYSSKAMIGAWAVSGLISLALLTIGILWLRTATWWLILVALLLLPWLYSFTLLCYRRWSIRYFLTTQRFIHESGILRRVNNRIEVLDMDDIAFEQGLLERLVGVGTIRIVSSDRSHPIFAIFGIEDVKRVSELFDDARRIERRRRGLHVEQI